MAASARLRKWQAAHLQLGQRGEDAAARLVQRLGMRIVVRNYAGPHGEIDLIARDGNMLCFIEVKTRQASMRGRPIDAVTAVKKWHIVRTANRYLRQLGCSAAHRFDVIELVYAGRRLADCRYWPDEFRAEDVRRLPAGSHDPQARFHVIPVS